MRNIPGFWQDAPPNLFDSVDVESFLREFVRSIGGLVIEDALPEPRLFANADFAFPAESVVAELKEIETEFSNSASFKKGFSELLDRVAMEQPDWRPTLLGGDGKVPKWLNSELIRLFRPPLSRILKKANLQLRETKQHFEITSNTGVLLLVNDGFTSISPYFIQALISEILLNSYSSISCCVYLTVNRYIDFPEDAEPKLIWSPKYAEAAPDSLVEFVDDLGRQWFNFIESKLGSFTSRREIQEPTNILRGTRAVLIPD